jgi:methylphosphotriester-DNA--protein-cysteine methyltransferase
MGTRTRGCVERATPAKIAGAERQRKALVLRMAGATFQAIADALGYGNRSSATDAITRALRDTTPKELTDEVRRIENERLDRL